MSHPKFEFFKNRLQKNYRHIGKWARKQEITCFRVYDNDMPEFPLAIDSYDNIIHVAEYAREHLMSDDDHAEWLDGCIATISEVLDVSPKLIYMKFRERQKGLQQYERFSRVGSEYIVRENGLRFVINPSDYLDTGLFLDHRDTRQRVRMESGGKKVLNLFAYTGAFSVYAAAGGALSTLSVDMSNTYLQWADRNLTLNGFSGDQHRFLQADILQWLNAPPTERFDLIVIDPPTFSNSKRMYGTLDIQRDYAWMLNTLINRFANPNAVIYFSTNHRKFKFDLDEVRSVEVQNITKQTIPNDFRNDRIHQCYRIS